MSLNPRNWLFGPNGETLIKNLSRLRLNSGRIFESSVKSSGWGQIVIKINKKKNDKKKLIDLAKF